MQSVELTFGRAFKVWWSYSWRAFVLALLVLVPLEIMLFWYMMSHLPKQGAAAAARVAGTIALDVEQGALVRLPCRPAAPAISEGGLRMAKNYAPVVDFGKQSLANDERDESTYMHRRPYDAARAEEVTRSSFEGTTQWARGNPNLSK